MKSTHSQRDASSGLFVCLLILCAAAVMSPAVANDAELHNDIAATVSRVSECTVRIDTRTDRSSGVIISPDGHILTVAHGLRGIDSGVEVVLFNGQQRPATVLKRWPDADVALLKLTSLVDDSLAYLPVTATFDTRKSSNKTDVLSFGYPAREPNGLNPVVRLGSVAASNKQYLRSSCSLTAGDSGGPITTLGGELLGIHQKIGVGRASNRHLTLETCVQQFMVSSAFTDFRDPIASPQQELPAFNVSAGHDIRQITVAVSLVGEQQRVTDGTLVSSSLIVTKLSELRSATVFDVRYVDGSTTLAKLMTSDSGLDLAFLQLKTEALDSAKSSIARVSHSAGADQSATLAAGTVIWAGRKQLPGIISRVRHSEPSMKWKLGLQLHNSVEAEIVVEGVSANSAATDAGIQVGDTIVELDRVRLHDLDDVSNALQNRQPGDRITFAVRRGEKSLSSTGVLRHDVSEMLRRTEFLDGRSGKLSARRSGFVSVIQHDAALRSQELGSPLLNAAGQLVGINIARRSRESVLAVPIEAVMQLVNSASP